MILLSTKFKHPLAPTAAAQVAKAPATEIRATCRRPHLHTPPRACPQRRLPPAFPPRCPSTAAAGPPTLARSARLGRAAARCMAGAASTAPTVARAARSASVMRARPRRPRRPPRPRHRAHLPHLRPRPPFRRRCRARALSRPLRRLPHPLPPRCPALHRLRRPTRARVQPRKQSLQRSHRHGRPSTRRPP